jgi:hypothetical protein
MLGWDRYGFHKKHVRTRDNKHVFFHPVGSAGHVVYSGCASGARNVVYSGCASRARNVKSLFFLLRWDRCGFHEKRAGSQYDELLFLHPVGTVGYVSCLDETGTDSIESGSEHVTSILCFCIRWHLKVTSCIPPCLGHETSTHYFSCSGGTCPDSTKARQDMSHQRCVLHPVGSAGRLVHSGSSGA